MEKLYRFLINFLNSLSSVLKIILKSGRLKPNPEISDDTCFILGNGPSLKESLKTYGNQIRHYDTFCVNNFPSTEFFEEFKPKHFVIASKEFYQPDYSRSQEQKTRDKILESLIKKTDWDLNFFLPQGGKKAKDFNASLASNPKVKLQYYNNTPVEGFPNVLNLFMKNRMGLPRPHNVLIPSIYLAIQLGYKNIYLIGADHSWLPLISVNDKNQALVNQKHFYEESANYTNRTMHRGGKPRRLHEILEKFMYSFRSYFTLRAYANYRNAHVFNCTPNSFIDAFERKDLKNLFSDH